MEKKIMIIGSGLAGAIAYNYLRAYEPTVLELRPETPTLNKMGTHPAIMRLRDPQVAKYIGADCTKIKVCKGVFHDRIVHTSANIQMNNLYSMKVYGELGRRSLNKLGDQERWLIKSYQPPDNILWGRRVKGIHDGEIHCEVFGQEEHPMESYPYDICISTLPMPVMVDVAGVPEDFKQTKFEWKSIWVLRLKLNIPSNIHQTLYYTELPHDIYRATIQNQDLIIETTKKPDSITSQIQQLSWVFESFGIQPDDANYYNNETYDLWKKMPIGKIKAIDEDDRMRYIMWLTDYLNIFSFGRFAVWQPLRTDHLISDIEKIHRIIKASDVQSRYYARM